MQACPGDMCGRLVTASRAGGLSRRSAAKTGRPGFGTGWAGWLGYFLGFKSTAIIGKDVKFTTRYEWPKAWDLKDFLCGVQCEILELWSTATPSNPSTCS